MNSISNKLVYWNLITPFLINIKLYIIDLKLFFCFYKNIKFTTGQKLVSRLQIAYNYNSNNSIKVVD